MSDNKQPTTPTTLVPARRVRQNLHRITQRAHAKAMTKLDRAYALLTQAQELVSSAKYDLTMEEISERDNTRRSKLHPGGAK